VPGGAGAFAPALTNNLFGFSRSEKNCEEAQEAKSLELGFWW